MSNGQPNRRHGGAARARHGPQRQERPAAPAASERAPGQSAAPGANANTNANTSANTRTNNGASRPYDAQKPTKVGVRAPTPTPQAPSATTPAAGGQAKRQQPTTPKGPFTLVPTSGGEAGRVVAQQPTPPPARQTLPVVRRRNRPVIVPPAVAAQMATPSADRNRSKGANSATTAQKNGHSNGHPNHTTADATPANPPHPPAALVIALEQKSQETTDETIQETTRETTITTISGQGIQAVEVIDTTVTSREASQHATLIVGEGVDRVERIEHVERIERVERFSLSVPPDTAPGHVTDAVALIGPLDGEADGRDGDQGAGFVHRGATAPDEARRPTRPAGGYEQAPHGSVSASELARRGGAFGGENGMSQQRLSVNGASHLQEAGPSDGQTATSAPLAHARLGRFYAPGGALRPDDSWSGAPPASTLGAAPPHNPAEAAAPQEPEDAYDAPPSTHYEHFDHTQRVEPRDELGLLIDSLHALFEQDRSVASQNSAARCGVCYLHYPLADLEYREAEGFYVCPKCMRSLGHAHIPMLRRQQR